MDCVRKGRVRELVEEEVRGARSLASLRKHPELLRSLGRVGTVGIAIAAGFLGGLIVTGWLAEAIGLIPGVVVGVLVVAFFFLVLGELVPQSLALRDAERWALRSAWLLRTGAWVLRPAGWFATKISNLILRSAGDSTSFSEVRLAPEEIQENLEEAGEAGVIDPRAGGIAVRAIDFGELSVSDVMVPRNRVVAIARDAPPEELRRVLLEEGHMRMPVYEGGIDEVVGYVSIKDVLALAWESKLVAMEDLIRPAFFVPETMDAVQVLQELQRRRISMAIVVEESGGMGGIVTVEDLVEELVGEIYSEEESKVPEPIQRGQDRTALVLGIATVRDVNWELGLELPEGDGEYSTIAGLSIELAGGRIPKKGERLVAPEGSVLEIAEASPRRVRAVRIHLPPLGEASPPP